MLVFNIVLLATALVVLLPLAFFCLEVLVSLWPGKQTAANTERTDPRVAVLIPAHNEQAAIGRTLRTLLPTLGNGCRVVVVADNCDDNTAAICLELGAEVIERRDASRRGKGFALDFGLIYLAKCPLARRASEGANGGSSVNHDGNPTPLLALRASECGASEAPPDVVVFLDADCQVEQYTVWLLATAAHARQLPIQGLNLCQATAAGGVNQTVAALAFRFKNLVRALGLSRLAGVCHLTGTGMAIPWELIPYVKLADGNVVEDMQLGIDLALRGCPPQFEPRACVNSPFPEQTAGFRTQRTRWEHGHLKTLFSQAPRLLALAVRQRRFSLLLLAFDLAIPPLSLLVMIWGATFTIGLIALAFAASPWPLLLLALGGAALAVAILVGWWVHCWRVISFTSLLLAPLYALRKLPIYGSFLARRQQEWVRTARDASLGEKI